MAWETRGTKSYYYRSQRIGNKVRRIYCGTGEAGKRAEKQHKKEQAQRREWQEEKKECAYFQLMLKAAALLFKLDAQAEGMHLTRGVWRQMNARTYARLGINPPKPAPISRSKGHHVSSSEADPENVYYTSEKPAKPISNAAPETRSDPGIDPIRGDRNSIAPSAA